MHSTNKGPGKTGAWASSKRMEKGGLITWRERENMFRNAPECWAGRQRWMQSVSLQGMPSDGPRSDPLAHLQVFTNHNHDKETLLTMGLDMSPSCAAFFWWPHLVHCCAHRPLEDHLKHLGVCWVLVCGKGQLLGLLLHVFNSNLNGGQYDLRETTPTR